MEPATTGLSILDSQSSILEIRHRQPGARRHCSLSDSSALIAFLQSFLEKVEQSASSDPHPLLPRA